MSYSLTMANLPRKRTSEHRRRSGGVKFSDPDFFSEKEKDMSIVFMDKNARIIVVRANFYPQDGPQSALSADDILLGLLEKLPREEFLRGPHHGDRLRATQERKSQS